MHLYLIIQECTQPAKAHCSASIAQHLCSQFRVGGVNADVQRREPLGHNALKVCLCESSEGGEVSVEERQPVVVVFQVEASTHARRKLVDKAELAVVIAGSDLVEYGGINLYAERCTRRLDDIKREFEAIPQQVKRDLGLIGQHSIFNNVAHWAAINSKHLIAGKNPKQVCGGSRSHRHNCGHCGCRSYRGSSRFGT
ncbi:unannotated protein [freshwater metagenome]|uniref:Unannotated protein n=1 Tax=freshwater metagenome TaxID=449393 RepID=A0A6J6BQ61_9ZZZZ